MQFSSIIGQGNIKEHLINTVKDNRISHAQLFVGDAGYGTMPLAIAYAQYVMCTDKSEVDSCGVCNSCKKIQKLQHPDLHFSYPTVGAKGGSPLISDDYIDAWRVFIGEFPYGSYESWMHKIEAGNSQGLIKVDEANSIIKKLSLKSFESEYKVLIMWYPEKMNAETANKLLKLIEEPPEKSLFILVTESPGSIINTIRSRTQVVRIPRISEDNLFKGLIQKNSMAEDKARHISRMSEGSYLRAQELIETSEEAKESFDAFTQMMRLSYSGRIPDLIKWVDGVSRWGRERQKTLLEYSLKMVRENLVINHKQNELARISDDESEFAVNFSRFIHKNNAFQISEELSLAILHIVRNANVKVVLLDLCLRLNRLLKIADD